jgi:hypothetical protein
VYVRGWVTAALALLFAGACGQDPGSAGGAEARRAVVEVGLADNGDTIGLDPGDVLELNLNEPGGPPRRWVLVRFPKDVLVLESSDRLAARYEFEVRGEGRGRLFALDLAGPDPIEACGRGVAAPAARCPASRALRALEARPIRGPGIFSVTIVAA